MSLKENIANFLKNTKLVKKINFNSLAFYFLFKVKSKPAHFKVKIQTKCLVLSQYPGAETRALGGLIAQYPKNFEVLALTNGSNLIKSVTPIESINIKKHQFEDVMKHTRIKGYKVFDINSDELINSFKTFKKIDISEADYIFIPNIYDPNPDTKALLVHFKKLLKTKEHKKELQILMYESDWALPYVDFWADISNISNTKEELLKIYYPAKEEEKIIDGTMGLNKFRALQLDSRYAEGFMNFSVEDFLKIPMI